jgi:hypothetical protein
MARTKTTARKSAFGRTPLQKQDENEVGGSYENDFNTLQEVMNLLYFLANIKLSKMEFSFNFFLGCPW